MSFKRNRRKSRDVLLECCAQPGEEDGLDPKLVKRDQLDRRGSIDRKTRQLCAQVAAAADYVLSGQTDDDVLSGLVVAHVVPAAHRGYLVVTVTAGPMGQTASAEVVLPKLAALTRRVRAEVGVSITRRKVPELTFVYLPLLLTEIRHD